MAKAKSSAKPQDPVVVQDNDGPFINLAALLSRKPVYKEFKFWIVGDTPLITHAWSEKAKRQMLEKQGKATRAGKEARDPHADFVASLYEMGNGHFGFPATGLKKCILSAAHKDKGIARSYVREALWLDADIVRVRPALAGAVCDMPLVRVFGVEPEMREDMVKVGVGMSKTASLAYRGQFSTWAMRITGKLNPTVVTAEALAFLVQEAGLGHGIGEWRCEKDGIFGAFHLGDTDEEAAWEAFAAGKGDMPVVGNFRMAAD